MGYTPYTIANFDENSGLQTYHEPFLIPEKAFPRLEDAFCWRGRVRRRQGNLHLGRLRRTRLNTVLSTVATGSLVYNQADILAVVRANEPYAELEIGADLGANCGVSITINPGGPHQTIITDLSFAPGLLVSAGPLGISSGTVNYVTGAISLTFVAPIPAGGPFQVISNSSYFPALPCMGLLYKELNPINTEGMIAFDTRHSYVFDATLPTAVGNTFAGRFRDLDLAAFWTGDTYNYFWSTNYWKVNNQTLFFATNFNRTLGASPQPGDPIRYWNGTNWIDFLPIITSGGNELNTCRCLLPFKKRLIAFNTIELTAGSYTAFPNRIRYCQIGTPLPSVDATAWRQDIPGKGGYLDLPTSEIITSVSYLKDVVIIKCEKSSWKLIDTGNEILPFIIQKINSDYGSESTFNLVGFDDKILSIGNFGLTGDDTTGVTRIDVPIPSTSFKILNTGEEIPPGSGEFRQQIERVYGIRDFINELVYWSYPDRDLYQQNITNDFCNQILVYNYRNQTFAKFNDSYTCFGHFQYSGELTTSGAGVEFSSIPNAPEIIAGNQQGFVSVLNKQLINGKTLAINRINILGGGQVNLTVQNHNLTSLSNYWIKIDGINGLGADAANPENLNYSPVGVGRPNTNRIYHITNSRLLAGITSFDLEYWDSSLGVFVPQTLTAGGTYIGGGSISIVQNFEIWTKTFAPFYEQGSQGRLHFIDFLLDKTQQGQFSCDLYINEAGLSFDTPNSLSMNDPRLTSNQGLLGKNIIETKANALIPFQTQQHKLLTRFFTECIGQNFELKFSLNNDQISNAPSDYSTSIVANDVILHAMILYFSPNARLTQ